MNATRSPARSRLRWLAEPNSASDAIVSQPAARGVGDPARQERRLAAAPAHAGHGRRVGQVAEPGIDRERRGGGRNRRRRAPGTCASPAGRASARTAASAAARSSLGHLVAVEVDRARTPACPPRSPRRRPPRPASAAPAVRRGTSTRTRSAPSRPTSSSPSPRRPRARGRPRSSRGARGRGRTPSRRRPACGAPASSPCTMFTKSSSGRVAHASATAPPNRSTATPAGLPGRSRSPSTHAIMNAEAARRIRATSSAAESVSAPPQAVRQAEAAARRRGSPPGRRGCRSRPEATWPCPPRCRG